MASFMSTGPLGPGSLLMRGRPRFLLVMTGIGAVSSIVVIVVVSNGASSKWTEPHGSRALSVSNNLWLARVMTCRQCVFQRFLCRVLAFSFASIGQGFVRLSTDAVKTEQAVDTDCKGDDKEAVSAVAGVTSLSSMSRNLGGRLNFL